MVRSCLLDLIFKMVILTTYLFCLIHYIYLWFIIFVLYDLGVIMILFNSMTNNLHIIFYCKWFWGLCGFGDNKCCLIIFRSNIPCILNCYSCSAILTLCFMFCYSNFMLDYSVLHKHGMVLNKFVMFCNNIWGSA